MIPHLLPAVRAVMVGAAVVAVLLARRASTHRPFAVALGVQTGVMLARWALLEFYLRGAIAAAGGDVAKGAQPAVLHGWALVAGVAMNAGWLVGPAGLAMLSMWVFGDSPPAEGIEWHRAVANRLFAPALVWLVTVTFIALSYPEGRPLYPKLFAGAEVAAVVVGLGSAGSWTLRGRWRDGLGITRGCTLFMVGCGAVSLAGPYVHGIFSSWWLANAVQLVMYSGLILAQGGALWVSR